MCAWRCDVLWPMSLLPEQRGYDDEAAALGAAEAAVGAGAQHAVVWWADVNEEER